MRRSQRSLQRSGYAFAHQEGFGELITKGTNMRNGLSTPSLHNRRKAGDGVSKGGRNKGPGAKAALNAANGEARGDTKYSS